MSSSSSSSSPPDESSPKQPNLIVDRHFSKALGIETWNKFKASSWPPLSASSPVHSTFSASTESSMLHEHEDHDEDATETEIETELKRERDEKQRHQLQQQVAGSENVLLESQS